MAEIQELLLDSGARLEFHDLTWTSTGRLFCLVVVYAPGGGIIASAKVELSSSQSRYHFAQDCASRNGAHSEVWGDALLSAWHSLEQQRRDARERLSPRCLTQETEPPALEFVWQDILPVGFPSNVYGDGGASKSTTILGLGVSVTQGWDFLGVPTKPGPVCFLDWELDEATFLRRLYPICRGLGMDKPPENLFYNRLTEPLAYHLDDLIAWCHEVGPVLIVVDSLGPAAAADPNDAEVFIQVMQQQRKLERACLNVDHQSKGNGQSYKTKRAIGSGYKDFLVRGGIQLELASSVPGRASIVMRHSKHNFTAEHEPIPFHIRYGIGVITFELGDITELEFAEADTLPLDKKILKILMETTGPIDADSLMEESGASSKQVLQNNISKLRREGKAGKQKFTLHSETIGKQTFYTLETH